MKESGLCSPAEARRTHALNLCHGFLFPNFIASGVLGLELVFVGVLFRHVD